MKLSHFLILLLGLLAVTSTFFATPAYAQDDVDEDEDGADAESADDEDDAAYEQPEVAPHPLTNMEGPSPDVITTYVLPGHTGGAFDIAVNKDNSIIVGFVNKCEADSEGNAMKVRAIGGSLNSAYNFGTYIQNFTIIEFKPQEVVDPGAEMTFEFNFKVERSTDLQQSQLALTIFYEDENEDFTTTFFNETVMLFEESGSFTQEVIGTYVILLGICAACGYLAWGFVKAQMGIKSTKTKAVKSSSSGPADPNEYMEDFLSNDVYSKKKKSKRKKN